MFVKLLVRSVPPTGIPGRLVATVMVAPLQTSTAVGMSNPQSVPHCTSLSGPQARRGGCVSTMVKVWLQRAVLLQASVARQVRDTLNSLGQLFGNTLVVNTLPVTALVTAIGTIGPSQTSRAEGAVKANGL